MTEIDKDTIVFTPEYVVNQLFDNDYFSAAKAKSALDPGCGRGIFSKAIKERAPKAHVVSVDAYFPFNEYSDVHFKGDFNSESVLKMNDGNKFDIVIGNPPFSDAMRFIDEGMKSLSEKGDLIFLLRSTQLNPKKTREIREKYWLKEVLTLEKRISFEHFTKEMRKGSVDSRDYSWFHFKHRSTRKDYAINTGGTDRFSTTLTYIPNETMTKKEKEANEQQD